MLGFEPERVCRLEKQYGVLFFRQSAKSVTESVAFSRQAMQYVAVCRRGRSNPVRVTKKKNHPIRVVLLRIVIVDFIQLYCYNMNVNCDFKLRDNYHMLDRCGTIRQMHFWSWSSIV